MLCTRSTGYFKPNASEQYTSGAKSQLPLAAQFMNVKMRTLHVAARALRIVPTRTLTAHDGETPVLTRSKDKFNRGGVGFRFSASSSGPSQSAVVRVNTLPRCHCAVEVERRHSSKLGSHEREIIERHQRLVITRKNKKKK